MIKYFYLICLKYIHKSYKIRRKNVIFTELVICTIHFRVLVYFKVDKIFYIKHKVINLEKVLRLNYVRYFSEISQKPLLCWQLTYTDNNVYICCVYHSPCLSYSQFDMHNTCPVFPVLLHVAAIFLEKLKVNLFSDPELMSILKLKMLCAFTAYPMHTLCTHLDTKFSLKSNIFSHHF